MIDSENVLMFLSQEALFRILPNEPVGKVVNVFIAINNHLGKRNKVN